MTKIDDIHSTPNQIEDTSHKKNLIQDITTSETSELLDSTLRFDLEIPACPLQYGIYRKGQYIGYTSVRSSITCMVFGKYLIDIPNDDLMIESLEDDLYHETSDAIKADIRNLITQHRDHRLSTMTKEERKIDDEIHTRGLLDTVSTCIQEYIKQVGEDNLPQMEDPTLTEAEKYYLRQTHKTHLTQADKEEVKKMEEEAQQEIQEQIDWLERIEFMKDDVD